MITQLLCAGVSDLYATTIELDDLIYPLNKFSWYPELGNSRFPKSNAPGSWKTRSRTQTMTIEISGAILGSTTAEYWTRRKALAAKIIPPPDDPAYPEFDHTRFIATFDGDATVYYADCILTSNIGALESTGAPTVSEFELMFECREGYWTAGLGGPKVVI